MQAFSRVKKSLLLTVACSSCFVFLDVGDLFSSSPLWAADPVAGGAAGGPPAALSASASAVVPDRVLVGPEDQDLFGFLEAKPLSGLSRTIVEVTGATPHVSRQVLYALSSLLTPLLEGNDELGGRWNGFKEALRDPEDLIRTDQLSTFCGTSETLPTRADQEPLFFQGLINTVQIIREFQEYLTRGETPLLESFPQRGKILGALESLSAFYTGYQETIWKKVCSYCAIPRDERSLGRWDQDLKPLLQPKALLMGANLGAWSFWRVSQETARHMISVDEEGHIPSSPQRGGASSNHRVSSLPRDNPALYFKADGHPPLKPGNQLTTA